MSWVAMRRLRRLRVSSPAWRSALRGQAARGPRIAALLAVAALACVDSHGFSPMLAAALPAGELVLLTHRMCPFAQRARFALQESGLPCTVREIELHQKPRWFLELNPEGRVPVMVDEAGRAIVESERIVDEVAARAPGRFGGGCQAEWRGVVNDELLPAGRRAKLFGVRSALPPVLERLDGLVGSPFVAGDTFGAGDVSAAPIFQRLFEAGMVPESFRHLHSWWAVVSRRPAFMQTRSAMGSYWWWW